MKRLLILPLILLNGCYTDANGLLTFGYNWDKDAQCKQTYGETAGYNQIADLCVDRASVNPMGAMLFMNQMNMNSAPSSRYVAPQIPMTPMNRCNTLVIGNQLTTSCY